MAVQQIRFEVAGEAAYVRGFEALASEVEDMSEPLSEIGEQLRHNVAEQFLTEGSTGNLGRWQPLDPDYERWKRSQVGEMPILVYTGEMFAAATDRRSVTVTAKRMVYEVDDPKAIYHQKGSGNLPVRRLVDLSLAQRREWDRTMANWLQRIRRGPLWAA